MSTRLLLPLTIVDGRPVTVPEDDPRDVEQCLRVAARTRAGSRWDHPRMGVTPRRHLEETRLDPDAVARELARSEPRGTLAANLDVTEAVAGEVAAGIRIGWRTPGA